MHVSRSIYRFLLRLCPEDLRDTYGSEMEALFLSDLRRARGVQALTVWHHAITDLLRHGVGARNDERRRYRRTSAYREHEGSKWTMDTWRYDLRHAMRSMAKRQASSATVVLTLALAIGANTAVFSAVYGVLIKPLPYPDPEGLVMLWESRQAEGAAKNVVSAADFLDWQRMTSSFTAMTALLDVTADLTGEGEPEKIAVAAVSPRYFDVFGVSPALGRGFEPGEDSAGRNRVVVLSHGMWRQRFGSDPSIVGRTLLLNGLPNRIIGVLPPGAVFPNTDANVFVPVILQAPGEPPSRTSHQFFVYARLNPGVGFEQARAEMERVGRDLEAQYPDLSRGHGATASLLSDEVGGPIQRTLLVLMAAVVFVLLIACINVTNLLLATGAGRRREMAIRSAIGAARLRLVRQVLVECGVMVLGGGALGLAFAIWAVRLLALQLPAVTRPDHGLVLSAPVLMFTAAISVITALLAGVLPAWHLVRDDPAEPLKEGGRQIVSLKRALRFGLIVTEVALTSLLLVAAGLTLRSFQRVLSEPAGIETANRLTFRIGLAGARYQDAATAERVFADIESRLAAEPLVRSVGAAMLPPLTGLDGRQGVAIENRERQPGDAPTRAHPRVVTANYLSTIGAVIRQGRGFLPTDTRTSLRVAIVNETMAKRYWPGVSPIGQRARFASETEWREVVGVVGDIKHWGLDAPVNPEMYMPVGQWPAWALTFVLRTNGDPLALIPLAQRHVHDIDPALPLFQIRTLDDIAARSVDGRKWTLTLLAIFAAVALSMAAAGIYGVMAHLVALRTPEIGVRLTLGASPARVMGQVLWEATLQAALGLAMGLAASLALMSGMRSILFGIEPTDPTTLAAVGVGVIGVSLLAVAVPAWRAMRVDPVTALRS